MQKPNLYSGGLLLIAALSLVGGAGVAHAEGGPPEAHKSITEFTGPETCAMCHPDAGQEVVQSLHYQQQGEVPYREGWEEGVLGGMYVTY
jgi:hypothetical protein